ncbi:M1 family metallopeptidase [Actinomadura viridis]|uniref:Aminopeptidase N n=1 Tax=Actinomadura viridis TaxID=58110 RepID=A0A931DEI2_9ACTN|nr:M1 family metallopeptidase [Actinomadura viridis]MBG6087148.1 aminopeptidase N [Actinomadura viridis]
MKRTPRTLTAVALTATAGLLVSAAPAAAAERFTPGAPGAGDPYFPDMGNGGYDVAHYDIGLKYDPATKGVQAVTGIKARATQNLSRFNLDFLGPLTISALKVNGRTAAYKRTGAQELEITPPRGLRKNSRFTVTVAYAGVPQRIDDPALGTSGWIATGDGAVMVNQPFGAATVFPVNDHPTDKATYTFTLTAPEALTTLANGDFAGKHTKGGWTTSRWRMRQPMASELSMLAIGRYDVISGRTASGVPNITATDRGLNISPELARTFQKQTGDIQEFLASLFGRYPFSSTGGIAVKAGVGYALETQGRPVYDLARRPGTAPRPGLIAHEIAHQWYGDSVTPERWADIWLNEGFASYAEWLYAEKYEGKPVQQSFDETYATPADDDLWKPITADPGRDDLYHSAVYDRGAMTVHALRKAIGEEDFAELIKAWPTAHRDGNASTQDFIRFAEKISGKQLDDLFDKWVYTSGKPAL